MTIKMKLLPPNFNSKYYDATSAFLKLCDSGSSIADDTNALLSDSIRGKLEINLGL